MNRLAVANRTAKEFVPLGIVGLPAADCAHFAGDVPLDLALGRPRIYAVGHLAVPVSFVL